MKKHLILTSVLAIVATTGVANATIEGTEAAAVKANLETQFKVAPEKSDYALKAPDGSDSTLAEQTAADYTSHFAETSADGTNVVLNDGVILNIAQGSVDATDYKYASKNADGVVSMVDGDTAVADLSKDYTSEYITSAITVSTADSSAPTINLGTDESDAIYITGDGNYYLLMVGDDILLNGDVNITNDNPNTYQNLLDAYNEDVNAINTLYATLVGYKSENSQNAAAVIEVVDNDNDAIQDIFDNQATFIATNAQYTSDAAEYMAYDNSLAKAIDTSIAAGVTNGTNDAIDASIATGAIKDALEGKADADTVTAIAEDLADNYSTTAEIEAGIGALISTKETNISEQLGYDVTKNPANTEEENSLVNKLKSHDTNVVAAINTNYDAIATETERATAQEEAIRSEFTAADAETLATAKSYADSGDATTLASAKSYSDGNLATAKSYADDQDTLTLNSAKSYADAGNALTLHQANAYTDERVAKLDKDLSAGIASSAALSSVAVSGVSKGEVSFGAGFGHHNSQSAAVFGAAMGITDRWSVNAGAGFSNADVTVRAGTNYKFKLF